MSDEACLVSFDTDRIKEYLFAAPDLRKIRGASTLLDILNRADRNDLDRLRGHNNGIEDTTQSVIHAICPHISDDDIITVGGMAIAVVPKRYAIELIAAVENLYRRTTVTAGITGVSLPITEHALEHTFGECVAEVSVLLRSAKDKKGQDLFVPLTGWLRPCAACGRHPVQPPIFGNEGQPELLCHSCQKKDWLGKKARNLFYEGFIKFVKSLGGDYALWKNVFPDDLSSIGGTSRPSGYVGFIYADGNGIGALLEQLSSFQRFQAFAKGLDKIVRETTYRALLSAFTKPRENIPPFEILLMGGDDLMLVVAADAALEIAVTIVKEFEREANKLAHSPEIDLPADQHLSISAAVVIAHDSFPIQAMHTLATDLLRNAKAKSSEIRAQAKRPEFVPPNNDSVVPEQGTIDFAVITGATTAGLEAQRDHVLTRESFSVAPLGGEMVALTERPYTSSNLERLLCFIRKFKDAGFPQAPLNALYEALFRSKVQAQLAAMIAITRAKPEHRGMALEFFKAFDVPDNVIPWRQREDGSYSTALGDLIEAYRFVRGDCYRGE